MRRKLLIELFIYVLAVIIGVVLLITYKGEQKPIDIPSDFKIVRGESHAAVSVR